MDNIRSSNVCRQVQNADRMLWWWVFFCSGGWCFLFVLVFVFKAVVCVRGCCVFEAVVSVSDCLCGSDCCLCYIWKSMRPVQ